MLYRRNLWLSATLVWLIAFLPGVIGFPQSIEWYVNIKPVTDAISEHVIRTSNGDFVVIEVANTSSQQPGPPTWTFAARFTSAGVLVDSMSVETGDDSVWFPTCVIEAEDGGLIVVGWCREMNEGPSDHAMYWVKLKSDLSDEIWGPYVCGSENVREEAWSVVDITNNAGQQGVDDTLLIAGFKVSGSNSSGRLLKITADESGYAVEWDSSYGGTPHNISVFTSMDTVSHDSLIICGFTSSASATIVKADPVGHLVWDDPPEYGDHAEFWEVKRTSDGCFIAGGIEFKPGDDGDVIVWKINADGDATWFKQFTCPPGCDPYDKAYAIDVTENGICYVAGLGCGNEKAWVLQLDSDGDSLGCLNSTFDKELHGVAAAGDDACVVSGYQKLDSIICRVTKVSFEVLCGDANASGAVDIDDPPYIIAYVFSGGPEPEPYHAGDPNYDGIVDIDDAVYLIAYIFSEGPAPCDAFVCEQE